MTTPRPFPESAFRLLPKAELHLHLEGTLGPAAILAQCRRRGVEAPAEDPAGVARWLEYGGFEDFLRRYFFVCRLLREPGDFRRAALDYLLEAQRQGIVHVEFHLSSSVHCLMNHLPWEVVLDGCEQACAQAESEWGISSALIPDLSPKFGLEACRRVLDAVLANRTPRVAAVGFVGPTEKWLEEDYRGLADRARGAGLRIAVHAGEHGPPWEVAYALDEFRADRIQHGIAAARDPELLARLAASGVPCDVCLASNVVLGAVEGYAAHPLAAMLEAGVAATLSSDDPGLVHSTALDEYALAWRHLGLGLRDLAGLARNSLLHAFAPEEQRAMWLADWTRVARSGAFGGALAGD